MSYRGIHKPQFEAGGLPSTAMQNQEGDHPLHQPQWQHHHCDDYNHDGHNNLHCIRCHIRHGHNTGHNFRGHFWQMPLLCKRLRNPIFH